MVDKITEARHDARLFEYQNKVSMSVSNYTSASTVRGYVMLTLTALLWGTAFAFQKHAAQYTDAFTFNFLRFSLGIPALAVLYLLPKKLFDASDKLPQDAKSWQQSALVIGVGAGFFMFVGISLQQLGLSYTTTGKSGFLTSLYIIILPLLGLFFRQRCLLEVWVGALLTVLGIYLMGSSNSGDVQGDFNYGDVLTLICAFAWAAQVLWLGILARHVNVLTVAISQMITVAFLSAIVMLVQTGLPSFSLIWVLRWDMLYTGVISAAFAFTLQILGQRHVPATNAALIMSTEAVFALLVGVCFLGEVITFSGLLGCCFILAGIIIAQLQGKLFFVKIKK